MTTDTEANIRLDPDPPFVWPSTPVLSGNAYYRFPVPFQQVLGAGSKIFGIVSAVDHRGAEWLKTVLDQRHDLQGLIILAVFAGCADSDEVAWAFRDDVARDYEMMSPGWAPR